MSSRVGEQVSRLTERERVKRAFGEAFTSGNEIRHVEEVLRKIDGYVSNCICSVDLYFCHADLSLFKSVFL